MMIGLMMSMMFHRLGIITAAAAAAAGSAWEPKRTLLFLDFEKLTYKVLIIILRLVLVENRSILRATTDCWELSLYGFYRVVVT